ncbi:hypothetical protein BDA99DRAFT_9914 [Phascolomyces articulosus]|uniref:Uncharacterized protein n=1 Tax=Phascolomyces articulosus TaxID=60185 RepID=A0AAD5KZJ5_9FUNG|nr:hypothetical protein BDA99DRAFT_9914 [Phascolomyces articulosus]
MSEVIILLQCINFDISNSSSTEIARSKAFSSSNDPPRSFTVRNGAHGVRKLLRLELQNVQKMICGRVFMSKKTLPGLLPGHQTWEWRMLHSFVSVSARYCIERIGALRLLFFFELFDPVSFGHYLVQEHEVNLVGYPLRLVSKNYVKEPSAASY